MTVAELYDDGDYNDELVRLAGKNLLEPDEYRQEVFLYLIEHSGADPRLAAKRIAMRMGRKQQREYAVSLDQMGDVDDTEAPSVLWEDRHVVA